MTPRQVFLGISLILTGALVLWMDILIFKAYPNINFDLGFMLVLSTILHTVNSYIVVTDWNKK